MKPEEIESNRELLKLVERQLETIKNENGIDINVVFFHSFENQIKTTPEKISKVAMDKMTFGFVVVEIRNGSKIAKVSIRNDRKQFLTLIRQHFETLDTNEALKTAVASVKG